MGRKHIGVLAATLAELDAAGCVESAAGQKALALAALIDAPPLGTLGSLAGWSREHTVAMATALADAAPVTVSILDELKVRRAKRGA